MIPLLLHTSTTLPSADNRAPEPDEKPNPTGKTPDDAFLFHFPNLNRLNLEPALPESGGLTPDTTFRPPAQRHDHGTLRSLDELSAGDSAACLSMARNHAVCVGDFHDHSRAVSHYEFRHDGQPAKYTGPRDALVSGSCLLVILANADISLRAGSSPTALRSEL